MRICWQIEFLLRVQISATLRQKVLRPPDLRPVSNLAAGFIFFRERPSSMYNRYTKDLPTPGLRSLRVHRSCDIGKNLFFKLCAGAD
jgi:hypothetical protein